MSKRILVFLLFAFLFLSGQATIQASPQSDVLYGVNSGDDGLSVIDPVTGQVFLVGPLDPDPNLLVTPISMAVRPSDRTIFVWNNSDKNPTTSATISNHVLLTVDPCTGLATRVGSDQGVILTIAFAPDGTLFGLSPSALFGINPTTGVATQIVTVNENIFGADFDASGTLFAITSSLDLVTIDTGTGAASLIATLSVTLGVPGSIVFDPATGTLIGSAFNGTALGGVGENTLFDIDPSDGTVTNIRLLVGGGAPQGMGFAPACQPEEAVTQRFEPGVTAQNFSFDGGNHTYTVTFDEVLTTFDLTITAVDTLPSVVKPRINVEVGEEEEEFPDSDCVPYATSGLCVVYQAEGVVGGVEGLPASGTDYIGDFDIYIGFLPLGDAGIRGRTTDWSEFVVVTPGVEFAKALLHAPGPITGNDFTDDITTDFLSNGLPIKELGNFCGIEPPVRADGSIAFKSGRTVPFKFKLSRLPDCSGDFITDAVALISSIVKTNGGSDGMVVDDFEASGGANTGNLFRSNPESLQYVFNLSTKGFAVGTYVLTIVSDKSLPVKVEFGIR